MQTWRRTVGACLALVVLSLAAPAVAGITPGKPAPEFSLRKLGGGRLVLRDLRGKVVLLTFWTEGCPPCHVEAPYLQALHQKYFGRGLRVVGVTPLNSAVADLHGFVRRHGITYPTLVDPGERVVKRYGLQAYPLTVLIDRQGAVRWVHQGFRHGDERRFEREAVRLISHR